MTKYKVQHYRLDLGKWCDTMAQHWYGLSKESAEAIASEQARWHQGMKWRAVAE